jgi:P-type conjugative transfer ATPase TrbB
MIAQQNNRSNMGNVTAITDEQHQRLEVKLRREFGDLILKLLADDRTEDILLNPDSSLWVKRMGEGFARIGEMSAAAAASALGTVAAWRGTVLNHEHPILETELPIDGSRFEAIVPPVVRRSVFAIRLRPKKVFSLQDYEESQIITHKSDSLNRLRRHDDFSESVRGLNHAQIIRAAVRARKNVLVVGSTGSGKTTLVNAILHALSEITPKDRVISIEDTTELQCPVANYLDLRAVGSVTMLECLRACMRLKPNRIVVGEVRGSEAHTLLKAWNTGHPGGAATVHANDAMSGLIRLESLVAEGTNAAQQSLIAEAVDLVIFVDEEPELKAGRKVREILLVTGYRDGQYLVEHV